MGSFRIRRSFKIAPGMRLNVSKSGLSTSTKLGRVTVNSRGRATVRVAKGVSYSTSTKGGRARRAGGHAAAPPDQKSGGVAFALWLLTGLLGGHRYYLGRTGTGFLQTITLGGVGLWWLLDLFLLGGMVRDHNQRRAVAQ